MSICNNIFDAMYSYGAASVQGISTRLNRLGSRLALVSLFIAPASSEGSNFYFNRRDVEVISFHETVKDEPLEKITKGEESDLLSSESLPSDPMVKQGKGARLLFHETPDHIDYRKRMDKARIQAMADNQEISRLFSQFPSLEVQHTDYQGVCYDYAAHRAFQSYPIPKKVQATNYPPGDSKIVDILDKYFTETDQPQKGDIAIYYLAEETPFACHFAIYLGENKFESKFGALPIIVQHSPFDVPLGWGKEIVFFTLKKELVQ